MEVWKSCQCQTLRILDRQTDINNSLWFIINQFKCFDRIWISLYYELLQNCLIINYINESWNPKFKFWESKKYCIGLFHIAIDFLRYCLFNIKNIFPGREKHILSTFFIIQNWMNSLPLRMISKIIKCAS